MGVGPVILVDCDDVLYDFNGLLFDILNAGKEAEARSRGERWDYIKREDVDSGVLPHVAFGYSDREIRDIYDNWGFYGLDGDMPIIDGAVEGVAKLTEKNDPRVATSRSWHASRHLSPVLIRDFKTSFSEHYFRGIGMIDDPENLKDGAVSYSSKVELARMLIKNGESVRAIIDDQQRNLEGITLDDGFVGVLFSRPWNVDYECDDRLIFRGERWSGVLDVLA